MPIGFNVAELVELFIRLAFLGVVIYIIYHLVKGDLGKLHDHDDDSGAI